MPNWICHVITHHQGPMAGKQRNAIKKCFISVRGTTSNETVCSVCFFFSLTVLVCVWKRASRKSKSVLVYIVWVLYIPQVFLALFFWQPSEERNLFSNLRASVRSKKVFSRFQALLSFLQYIWEDALSLFFCSAVQPPSQQASNCPKQ